MQNYKKFQDTKHMVEEFNIHQNESWNEYSE